jgi:hypothetical protein
MRTHDVLAVCLLAIAGCGTSRTPALKKPAKQVAANPANTSKVAPAVSDLSGLYPGVVPLTPAERAESDEKAKEMEADNARLKAVSLSALIPVLREKGYSRPDDTTVVGGPGDSVASTPGESFLMGACLGSDKKPHQLHVTFDCTKFGKDYTVDLRRIVIDNETIWLPEGYDEAGGVIFKKRK